MADPTAPVQESHRRPRPLPLHLAGLALVLLALVPVLGTGASFSADEGAAIVQARSLSRGDGWIVEHPIPAVDPAGLSYPLENSESGSRGVSPYAKHPLYPVLLAGADRVAGVTGMVLLSLVGTLAAAGLAGLLGRRLDPTLAAPTLWVVGVGSPLLFDGYLVIAHALAAALAAAAVLLAVQVVERRSLLAAAALAPVVAAGVLLRTEFVFLGVAVAVAVAVVGLLRHRLVEPALAAGVIVAAVGLARLGERAWTGRILGPATGGNGIAATALPGGGLTGRTRGFLLTWLTPGYGGGRPVELALLAMLALVALAAYVARRHPQAGTAVAVVAGAAAAAAALALVVDPANVVPGLLVACPLVAAGLTLLRRGTLATTAARLCAGTFGLFAVGVLATQYQRGGSGEWGGRYFALGLPVLVPVLMLALRDGGRRLEPRAGRLAAQSLAACVVLMSLMGVGALRAAHQRNATMAQAVVRATLAAPAADGGPPVVIAADGALARHSWPVFEDVRLLRAGPDLPGLVASLKAARVPTFVYLTRDATGPGPGMTVLAGEEGGGAGRSWHVRVVTAP